MNSQEPQQEHAQTPQQPVLCSTGCGFFANSQGMCSKCYRDATEKLSAGATAQAQQRAASPALVTKVEAEAAVVSPAAQLKAQLVPEAPSTSGAAATTVTPASTSSGAPAAPPAGPSRCFQCKKRVGLTGFKCKCEQVFCGQHRYAEAHCCEFDYKTVQRAKLSEQNPVIQASKVQKI